MRIKTVLAGLAVGSLVFGGVIIPNPFAGLAQDPSTPSGQSDEDDNDAKVTPIVGTPLLSPAIDLIAAQEAALVDQGGAVVIGIELDGDDGSLIYAVSLDNGLEVDVDATSGEVLKTEPIDEDDGDDEDQSGEDADEDGDVDETDDDDQDDDDGEDEDEDE